MAAVNSRWEDLTADDVRTRATRSGSRPRTKIRPSHHNATEGWVTATHRGRYTVHLDGRDITAVKARELGHQSVVVGDTVYLAGDTSGHKDTLARIVRTAPRRSELRRATEEGRGRERVIVAGADQMAIVVSLADPPPNPRMIDRQLVAAYDANMDALICLTKQDLLPRQGDGAAAPTLRDDAAQPPPGDLPQPSDQTDAQGQDPAETLNQIRAIYEPLGIEVVATGWDEADAGRGIGHQTEPGIRGLERLQELLSGQTTVLVGHSGVGKSTLINALVPGAGRQTGLVNVVTGKGRHTSSSALALELPNGGWVIDTPGVRSFGLSHVDNQTLLAAFSDLAEIAVHCGRGCEHGMNQQGCALQEWATGNQARLSRLDSYLRIAAGRQPN